MEMEESAAIELRAMRGAFDALRRDWKLDEREVGELLGGDHPDEGRLPAEAETRMRILIEIGHRLDPAFVGEELADRLRLYTAAFGWLTPLEAMSGDTGALRAVRAMVERGAWS